MEKKNTDFMYFAKWCCVSSIYKLAFTEKKKCSSGDKLWIEFGHEAKKKNELLHSYTSNTNEQLTSDNSLLTWFELVDVLRLC